MLCGQVFGQGYMSKIMYTLYISACASGHACAYVGPATHACIHRWKLYMWDLSLGIETLVENWVGS